MMTFVPHRVDEEHRIQVELHCFHRNDPADLSCVDPASLGLEFEKSKEVSVMTSQLDCRFYINTGKRN